MEAIGELDQQHAHVGRNGEEELAQIFRLRFLARNQVQPLDLGEAVDDGADLGAEQLIDLGPGSVGILDGIVQQRDRNGGVVELEVGEDRGHFERVSEVGVARSAHLAAMLLHGVDVGLVEQLLVGVRIIRLHALNEFELTHHGFTNINLAATPAAGWRDPSRHGKRRRTARPTPHDIVIIGSDAIRRHIELSFDRQSPATGDRGQGKTSRPGVPAGRGSRCRAAVRLRSWCRNCRRRRRRAAGRHWPPARPLQRISAASG